jgi:hypothetical protein
VPITAAEYQRRRAEGLCVRCQQPAVPGRSLCAEELESVKLESVKLQHRQRYQRRRQDGKCTECEDPAEGSRCRGCLDYSAELRRARDSAQESTP